MTEESNPARAEAAAPLHESLIVARWCRALEQALGEGALVEPAPHGDERARELTVCLHDGAYAATLGFEKKGAAAMLAPLLRSGSLDRGSTPETIALALGRRLAAEASRLCGAALSVTVACAPARASSRHLLAARQGRERFDVSLWLEVVNSPLLADLELELPLFVALSTAPRAELAELTVGDLWYPGEGWLDHAGPTSGAARNAIGERFAAEHGIAGRTVAKSLASADAAPQPALLGAPDGQSATWVALSRDSVVLAGPRTPLHALCAPRVPLRGAAEPGFDPASWSVVAVEVAAARVRLAEAALLAPGARLAVVRHERARLWVDGQVRASGTWQERPDGTALLVLEVTRASSSD